MGEARRRAAFRSRAGHSAPIGRGLLFPVNIEQFGHEAIGPRHIPEENLQSAILYWDRIACPTNNFIHCKLQNEEILMDEGILIRPKWIGSGSFNLNDILQRSVEYQEKQFAELERSQPGFWCFTESSPTALASTPAFEVGRSTLVELVGSLPLPPAGTPIENILEFKRKRAAELQHLRAALDDIYLKISDSNDQEMAFKIAAEQLDKSIEDLLKSSREWWKSINISDTKTLINLGRDSMAPFLVGAAFQMPAAGAIVGGVGAVLSIAAGIKSKLKSDRKSPFWYAVSVKREIG